MHIHFFFFSLPHFVILQLGNVMDLFEILYYKSRLDVLLKQRRICIIKTHQVNA